MLIITLDAGLDYPNQQKTPHFRSTIPTERPKKNFTPILDFSLPVDIPRRLDQTINAKLDSCLIAIRPTAAHQSQSRLFRLLSNLRLIPILKMPAASVVGSLVVG
jgi:hypothetical protein